MKEIELETKSLSGDGGSTLSVLDQDLIVAGVKLAIAADISPLYGASPAAAAAIVAAAAVGAASSYVAKKNKPNVLSPSESIATHGMLKLSSLLPATRYVPQIPVCSEALCDREVGKLKAQIVEWFCWW